LANGTAATKKSSENRKTTSASRRCSRPGVKFTYALNRYLPEDIIIQQSDEVESDFHPRHCDTRKTYCYRILNTEFGLPKKRNYTWNVPGNIDISKMQEAAEYLVGEHDFKSFCCVRTQTETTVRKIYSLDVDRKGDEILITVTGNGFLYNMVRIIAGTLIQVGKGKFNPEYVKEMLDAKDRTQAGQTAPPQGLTLMKIEYL
jgi:tRNA pseudouridine38-40 synthase